MQKIVGAVFILKICDKNTIESKCTNVENRNSKLNKYYHSFIKKSCYAIPDLDNVKFDDQELVGFF